MDEPQRKSAIESRIYCIDSVLFIRDTTSDRIVDLKASPDLLKKISEKAEIDAIVIDQNGRGQLTNLRASSVKYTTRDGRILLAIPYQDYINLGRPANLTDQKRLVPA